MICNSFNNSIWLSSFFKHIFDCQQVVFDFYEVVFWYVIQNLWFVFEHFSDPLFSMITTIVENKAQQKIHLLDLEPTSHVLSQIKYNCSVYVKNQSDFKFHLVAQFSIFWTRVWRAPSIWWWFWHSSSLAVLLGWGFVYHQMGQIKPLPMAKWTTLKKCSINKNQ
jgi:hypothetical protein